MKQTLLLTLICASLVCVSCSVRGPKQDAEPIRTAKSYMSSGTIILSRALPVSSVAATTQFASGEEKAPRLMAPLIAYIPPSTDFLPATNEAWLKIDRETNRISLYRGETALRHVQTEGEFNMAAGTYAVQKKSTKPRWYATDNYFTRRGIQIPSLGSLNRYRRGALGDKALYITQNQAIHSAPFWSTDVGGLRIAKAEIENLFALVPVGATVVVQ